MNRPDHSVPRPVLERILKESSVQLQRPVGIAETQGKRNMKIRKRFTSRSKQDDHAEDSLNRPDHSVPRPVLERILKESSVQLQRPVGCHRVPSTFNVPILDPQSATAPNIMWSNQTTTTCVSP